MTEPPTTDFLENPPFPHILQFETNTTCNANCLMCPHDKMRRRGTAKWSLISRVIREASNYNVEIVCPFLMQEPMLEPRLIPILANIRQRMPKTAIAVYSNMSTLPDKTTRQIIDYELIDTLHISFYGPTETLYRKWQPPLHRAKTIDNIKRLFLYRQKRKQTKPIMALHVLSVPELIEAAEGYADVLPYVDRIGNVQFDTFHGDIPDYAGPQEQYFNKPPAPRTPCQRLWTGVNVHFDGAMVPCCLDYNDEHVLGNASKDSLEDIWNSLNYRKFRLLHMQRRWNEIPMCRECVVHEYQFSEEWVTFWEGKRKLENPQLTSKC